MDDHAREAVDAASCVVAASQAVNRTAGILDLLLIFIGCYGVLLVGGFALTYDWSNC